MPVVTPRTLLYRVLDQLNLNGIEVFPKQDELAEDGVGSLVRGPLGLHLRSGRRYAFLNPETINPAGRSLNAQLAYLMQVRVNSSI